MAGTPLRAAALLAFLTAAAAAPRIQFVDVGDGVKVEAGDRGGAGRPLTRLAGSCADPMASPWSNAQYREDAYRESQKRNGGSVGRYPGSIQRDHRGTAVPVLAIIAVPRAPAAFLDGLE